MDADEARARLAEVDAQIAQELAKLGFTPEQIQRQLDPSVPEDVKAAERTRALEEHLVTKLNDPSSGLMESWIKEAAPDIERMAHAMAAEYVEKRKRRRKRIIQAAVALVVVGAGVWYFAVRDSRSTCERVVGSTAEVAKLTGLAVKSGHHFAYRDTCMATLEDAAGQGAVVDLSYEVSGASVDRDRFVDAKPITVGGKSAMLYIAGNAPERTTDEMLADAQSRVGRSQDPMGDALVAGPETKHLVVVPLGSMRLRVRLDRRISPEQAQAYMNAVVGRL